LAVVSLSFAVYMNTIAEPGAPFGVNARRSPNLEYRWRDPVARDGDVATASIGDTGAGALAVERDDRPGASAPLYRLVAVAGDRAYVEQVGGEPGLLIAVREGSLLSGAGRVVAIESRSGRWVITTTRAVITSDGR
jgi:hypothetical protein